MGQALPFRGPCLPPACWHHCFSMPLPPPLSCQAFRAGRTIWEEDSEPFLCPLLLYALASSKRRFFFMASMIKLYPRSYFLICLVLNFLSFSPKFNISQWACSASDRSGAIFLFSWGPFLLCVQESAFRLPPPAHRFPPSPFTLSSFYLVLMAAHLLYLSVSSADPSQHSLL